MKVGFIQLLDWDDKVLRYSNYSCRTGREGIIKMWNREYAGRLHGCFIHITPDDSQLEERVNEITGLNKKRNYKRIK